MALRRSLLLAVCAACAPGPGNDTAQGPSARVLRQPLVTTELALAPMQGGVPPENAYNPAAGWLGSSFIVVFDDSHDGIPRLAATRVTPNGVTLDTPPHVLRESTDSAQAPSIACAQTSCLVAWSESILNYAFGVDSRVVFARVGPQATPLDAPVLIEGAAEAQVATDGTRFAMTWSATDGMGHTSTRAARLDANGALLDPDGITVSTSAHKAGGIAFVGDRYVVSYIDAATGLAMAVTLDLDGGVGPAFTLPVPAGDGCGDVAVAAKGDTALLVADCWGALWSDVFVARWSPDAGLLDAAANRVTMSGGSLADTFGASVVAAPQGYWLGWSYDTGHPLASAGRVALDGTPIDTAPLTLSAASGSFSFDTKLAVSPAGDVIAVWDEEPNGSNVGLSRMSWDAGALDQPGIHVPPAPVGSASQSTPAFVCNATLCLASWVDYRGLYVGRLTFDGGTLDPAGIQVSPPVMSGGPARLVAAPDGFVLAWGDLSKLHFSHVFNDGHVETAASTLDAGMYWAEPPGLSFDGQRVWVTWSGGPADAYGVYRADLDAGAAPVRVSTLSMTGSPSVLDMASSQGQTLVLLWPSGVERLDENGNTIDFSALPPPGNNTWTCVSPDPDGWMIFGADAQIRAIRVWLDGGSTPSWPLADIGARMNYSLRASFDGHHHVVVWIDTVDHKQFQLLGMDVAPDGGLVDGPFVVPTATSPSSASVQALGPGTAVAAYTRYDDTAGYKSSRVFASFIYEVDAGSPDAGNPDAGGPDGGTPDASVSLPPDAGPGDVTPVDAGTPPGMGRHFAATCGANESGGGPLVMALLVLLRRLRRDRQ